MPHHQTGDTLFNGVVNGIEVRCFVCSRREVQSRAQLLWNNVEYMHMLFTFSASRSRAGTDAREFALTIPVVIQTMICSYICNIATMRRGV